MASHEKQNHRQNQRQRHVSPQESQIHRRVKPTGKSAYSTGVLAKVDPGKRGVLARIAIEILAKTEGPAKNNLGGEVSGTDFSLW